MAKKKTTSNKTNHIVTECYYTTETVSQLLSISPRTIHYYRKRGLIQSKRAEGGKEIGTVLHSRDDIETLKRIKRLTEELGVNLAGVEIILDLLERLEGEEK